MKKQYYVKRVSIFAWIISLLMGIEASNYQPPSYEISATLNAEARTISQVQKIRMNSPFSSPTSSFYLLVNSDQKEKNPFVSDMVNDVQFVNGFEAAGVSIKTIKNQFGEELKWAYVPDRDFVEFVEYSSTQNMVKVELKTPVSPSESFQLIVESSTKIPQKYMTYGNTYYKDTFVLASNWYPTIMPIIDGKWEKDRFVLMPHYLDRFELYVPNAYEVAIAGDRVQEELITSNRFPFESYKKIQVSHPAPIHRLAFFAGKHFEKVTRTDKAGTVVEVYFKDRSDQHIAKEYVTLAADIGRRYSQKYGKASSKRWVIIQSPILGLFGTANNGFIQLGNNAFSTKELIDPLLTSRIWEHILAHEIAHFWAGVGTAVDRYSENVLSEGLAEYMSELYMREKYGLEGQMYESKMGEDSKWLGIVPASFLLKPIDLIIYLFAGEWLAAPQDKFLLEYIRNRKEGWDAPLIMMYPKTNPFYNDSLEYGKGSWVFRMLSNYVGQKTFETALRQFIDKQSGRPALLKEFQNELQQLSNKPLDDFFQSWFYSSDSVDLKLGEVRQEPTLDGMDTQIEILKEGRSPVAFSVQLDFESGDSIRKKIDNFESRMMVTMNAKAPLKQITIDPDSIILETNRFNNRYKLPVDSYYILNSDMPYKRRLMDHYYMEVKPVFGTPFEQGIGAQLNGEMPTFQNWSIGLFHIYDETSVRNGQSKIGGMSQFNLTNKQVLAFNGDYFSMDDFSLGISLKLPLFQKKNIGSLANTVTDLWAAEIGINNSQYDSSQKYTELVASVSHPFSIWEPMIHSSAFLIAPGNAYWSLKTMHLVPFKLVTGNVIAAKWNSGIGNEIPNSKRFDANFMRGISRSYKVDQYSIASLDYMVSVLNGLELDAAISVLRGLSVSIFTEYGNFWTNDTSSMALTIGCELGLFWTSVLDYKIPIAIGYAKPVDVSGIEMENGGWYVSITTPINSFNALFGH